MPVRKSILSSLSILLICFTLLAKTFASDKPTSDDEAARDVIATCEKELENVDDSATFDLGVCLGILKGLHYLSPDVCIPPSVSLTDIARVLTKYFNTHSAGRQADFRERALDAMKSAWPCGSRRNI
jgi:hypothetical protein